MSYNKYLETDRAAKIQDDINKKSAASERLKKNAEWNKKNATKKELV